MSTGILRKGCARRVSGSARSGGRKRGSADPGASLTPDDRPVVRPNFLTDNCSLNYTEGMKRWYMAGVCVALLVGLAPVASAQLKLSELSVGMKIEVEWNGSWYPSEVVEVQAGRKGDNPGTIAPVLIHYIDYSSSSDEWVGLERIRLFRETPGWVEGPWVMPAASEDATAFMVAKAGKALILVNSGGEIFVSGKKVATTDKYGANVYINGRQVGWVDAKGQVRIEEKIVARWDWGGAGLVYGKEDKPRMTYSYGIIYLNDEPWGTALNNEEGVVADDGALVLVLMLFVPEFKP